MVKTIFYNFILSFILGICIQLFLQLTLNRRTPPSLRQGGVSDIQEKISQQIIYDKWLLDNYGYKSFLIDPDVVHYDKEFNGRIESDFLRSEIHIYCLIFVDSIEGAKTIQNTWGSHCNKIIFYSSKVSNSSPPITKLNCMSSFDLYCESIRQVNEDKMWVLIVKERTFAVIENLRFYLVSKNPNSHFYLGHPRLFWNIAYNWEDAGIVLSPGTVKTFQSAFDTKESCSEGGKYWRNGDWYLGKHLARLNITTYDTRDHLGRGRFNGFPMYRFLFPGGVSQFDNYWKDSLYPSPVGPKCCSGHAITFHSIPSDAKMYQMYYFFYKLRSFPAGGKFGNVPPSRQSKPTDGNKDGFM